MVEYTPGLIQEALAEGKVVFVDYGTDWCTTCAAQKRAIEKLRGENAAYDQNILFVHVNYDDYGTHAVATERNIPRRSTLILLKGNEEHGRIVASANPGKIKDLMDQGLALAAEA
jgi:thiol-disulfide isomerase/thioredoxin